MTRWEMGDHDDAYQVDGGGTTMTARMALANDVDECAMTTVPDGRAPDDDAALVRAARRDRAAFAPLYDRYADRVYAYLRLHVAQQEDAADLLQQVFLHALDGLPRYRGDGTHVVAWLFRIARNAVIDARRRQRLTLSWDAIPDALHPIGEHDPEAEVLRQEAHSRVRALVDALDEEAREVLVLRFTGRLSIADIALVIGKSEAATQKKLYRTMRALKEQYHAHD